MKFSWSDNGNLRQILFDATPGQTHIWMATVTEHPVEKGVAITDHVRPGPFRLSVDVVVSNTPIALPNAADDSFTDGITQSSGQTSLALPQTQVLQQTAQGANTPAKFGTLNQSGSATTFQWSAQFDRVRKVYEALSDLIGDAPQDGITVEATLALYDSMEIVSISVPRSADMGTAIRFTMDLQQIRIVEAQTVATPAPKFALKKRGHQASKEEKDAKKASFAHNVKECVKAGGDFLSCSKKAAGG